MISRDVSNLKVKRPYVGRQDIFVFIFGLFLFMFDKETESSTSADVIAYWIANLK